MTTLRKEIRIRAPKEDVRRVFADFGGISNWASATVSSYHAAHADGSQGAARHYDIADAEEQAKKLEEGRIYSYNIEGAPAVKHINDSVLVNGSGNETVVTLTSNHSLSLGPVGSLIDRLRLRHKIGKAMEESLAVLECQAETAGYPALRPSLCQSSHRMISPSMLRQSCEE